MTELYEYGVIAKSLENIVNTSAHRGDSWCNG